MMRRLEVLNNTLAENTKYVVPSNSNLIAVLGLEGVSPLAPAVAGGKTNPGDATPEPSLRTTPRRSPTPWRESESAARFVGSAARAAAKATPSSSPQADSPRRSSDGGTGFGLRRE